MKKAVIIGLLALILYLGYKTVSEGGLTLLAEAIKQHEGWFPGSRSYRNNNPGNLMYAGQAGAIGADDAGFAIFDSYQDGWNALLNQLQLYAERGLTIGQMLEIYAPPSDNDTQAYIQSVVNYLNANGVNATPDTLVSQA